MFTKKNLSRFLFVVAFMAALMVLTPHPAYTSSPANPITCSFPWNICGRVQNNSSRDLYIYGNKVSGGQFYTYILHPGQNSTLYLADTDQVGSPTSYLSVSNTVVGPWVYIKFPDYMSLRCYDSTYNGNASVACYWP